MDLMSNRIDTTVFDLPILQTSMDEYGTPEGVPFETCKVLNIYESYVVLVFINLY